MPAILRTSGFIFVIHPGDHEPPHVHIFKAGAELIINLGIHNDEPLIRDVYRMRNREIAIALAITRTNNDLFLAQWREIYP